MNPSLENDISCLLESMQYLGNDENQMIQALEHLAEMNLQGMMILASITFFKVHYEIDHI